MPKKATPFYERQVEERHNRMGFISKPSSNSSISNPANWLLGDNAVSYTASTGPAQAFRYALTKTPSQETGQRSFYALTNGW